MRAETSMTANIGREGRLLLQAARYLRTPETWSRAVSAAVALKLRQKLRRLLMSVTTSAIEMCLLELSNHTRIEAVIVAVSLRGPLALQEPLAASSEVFPRNQSREEIAAADVAVISVQLSEL
jgi:hypothetical protein